MTPAATQSLAHLRDPSTFQWYIIPMLLVVLYLYADNLAARRFSVVLGALAFWLMDWINEIWNGLLAHFSGFAPAWGTPGPSAFQILIGLNIEISFMFAVMGLYAMRLLPEDRSLRILGLDNRWFLAIVNSLGCVGVEILLNRIGALTWDWPYWSAGQPWLIFLIGYLPFFLIGYWVHDLASRRRQIMVVGTLAVLVIAAGTGFGGLGWI